jgi:MFS family permease
MSAPRPASLPSIVLPGSLAPLGYRNYAFYWIGLTASNTGRWIEVTGSVWLLYQLTGSPALLGFLGIAKAVPTLILQPFAGVIVDRVDQRRLLFVTQGLALLSSLCLGTLVVTGLVEAWHIYVQTALVAAISAFDVSVRQALFPRLVPRQQLADAVTLSATAGRASALVGPAIGGVAIGTMGVASPFFLNAATFLALMAAVALMRGVAPMGIVERLSFRGELSEGLRHVWQAPILSGLLQLEIVFGIFQINPVLIAILGREVLDVGPEGLGGLLAAPALGSLVGIGCLLILGQPRRGGQFVVLCQLGYAATLVAFAVSHDYLLSIGILAVSGLLDVLTTVNRLSIMQLAAPARMRGRIMANMRTVTGGIGPLAQAQSGILAGAIGGSLATLTAAVALAVAAATLGRTNRQLWEFSRTDIKPGPDAEGEA